MTSEQAAPSSTGRRRATPAWVPVVAGVAAFVVVLAGFGVVAGDWLLRNVEMGRLVTAIEASEDAMSTSQDAIIAVLDSLEGTEAPTDAQRATVDEELKQAAAQGRDRIADAAGPIEQVRVLPWHGDIERARAAYLRHSQAWQAYLDRATEDPDELVADQPEVNDSFMASQPLLERAIPQPPLFDLDVRVATIFDEGQADPSGPTQLAALVQ